MPSSNYERRVTRRSNFETRSGQAFGPIRTERREADWKIVAGMVAVAWGIYELVSQPWFPQLVKNISVAVFHTPD